MKRIKFSIVIVNYNNGLYLKECIESAINQTYENVEIIIVDDHSTDNSINVITNYTKRHKNIIFIKHQVNEGTLKTRNDGVRVCTGDYTIFLDSDDSLNLRTCETLYKSVKKQKYDIIHFKAVVYDCFNKKENIKADYHYLDWMNLYKHKTSFNNDNGLIFFLAIREPYTYPYNISFKCFKTDILKKSIICMCAGNYINGEDLYQFGVISMFAKNILLTTDYLYNYYFNRGMSKQYNVYNKHFFAMRFQTIELIDELIKMYSHDAKYKNVAGALHLLRKLKISQINDIFFNNKIIGDVVEIEKIISMHNDVDCFAISESDVAKKCNAYYFDHQKSFILKRKLKHFIILAIRRTKRIFKNKTP